MLQSCLITFVVAVLLDVNSSKKLEVMIFLKIGLISSLRSSNKIQQELIDILADGIIDEDEEIILEKLVNEMQDILNNIQAFILANQKRKE